MKKTTQIAARVIAKADREHPADLVFRTELKNTKGIVRSEGGLVSEAVFAYYRWLNWLNPNAIVEETRLTRRCCEIATSRKSPTVFSAPELQRAIPGWVKEAVKVSPKWLRALQLKPSIWLRARPGNGQGIGGTIGASAGWAAKDFRRTRCGMTARRICFARRNFTRANLNCRDLSSQVVGLACNPQPGETWWDACAGEGGKMLHLCDLMRNKGLVWASDRAEWRLQKLKRRAARAKIFNYRAVLVGRREVADEDEVRRHFGGCAVQRIGNVAAQSAGALDDDVAGRDGIERDPAGPDGARGGGVEAGRAVDLFGVHVDGSGDERGGGCDHATISRIEAAEFFESAGCRRGGDGAPMALAAGCAG